MANTIETTVRGVCVFTISVMILGIAHGSMAQAGTWTIGDLRFRVYEESKTHAVSLELPTRDLMRDFERLKQWGGIVFADAAKLDTELGDARVEIAFVAGDDGQHLRLDVAGRTFIAPIYDWQIIPIAEFVDSGQTGILTTTYSSGQRSEPIRFNAAFKDRLIGMRLLQAYYMIANPEGAWPLALYSDSPILGGGESKAIRQPPSQALKKVSELRFSWESWDDFILTDLKRPVTLRIRTNLKTRREEFQLVGRMSTLFWIMDTSAEAPSAVRVRELSTRTERAIAFLKNTNPHAVSALKNVYRYTALLRLVREQNPENWATFTRDVGKAAKMAELHPIRTPSAEWYGPGS